MKIESHVNDTNVIIYTTRADNGDYETKSLLLIAIDFGHFSSSDHLINETLMLKSV